MFRKAPEPLDPILVINAYALGIFPMADPWGRISWYAPDPRAILEHHNLHVSRSLRPTMRNRIYQVRMDTNSAPVMRSWAKREETAVNPPVTPTHTPFHYPALPLT